jgi:hypothetical protein
MSSEFNPRKKKYREALAESRKKKSLIKFGNNPRTNVEKPVYPKCSEYCEVSYRK